MAPGPLIAPLTQDAHPSKNGEIPFPDVGGIPSPPTVTNPTQSTWIWNVADASGYFRGLINPLDPQSYFDKLWASFASAHDDPGKLADIVRQHPELNHNAASYIESFGSVEPPPNIPPPFVGS